MASTNYRLSYGDIPPEVMPPSSSDSGLHSFTKLAIAYIGIILGIPIISIIYGVVITVDNPTNPNSLAGYGNYLILYYVVLIPLMLLTMEMLRRGKKLGAYLAFASMATHYTIYLPTILFLVTSAVVGILLWRSMRYLH